METKLGAPETLRPPETLKPELPKAWDYYHFKEYLLALTRGKDFLMKTEDYPDKMAISESWHKTLDQMRVLSRNNRERWAIIGFKEDKRSLYLPVIPEEGETNHIPVELMTKKLDEAQSRFGIVMIGDIHSHPGGWLKSVETIVINTIGKLYGEYKGFSSEDFYVHLYRGNTAPLMALVEPERNFFMFRTRETENLPDLLTVGAFKKYWYERLGHKEINFRNRDIGLLFDPRIETWEMAREISSRHHLVIYEGQPDKDLVKVLPVS